jgi:hypothetical protein
MKINASMNEFSGFGWLRINPNDRILTTFVNNQDGIP